MEEVGFRIAESHGSYLICFKMILKTEMGPYKLLAVLMGCKDAFPIVFPLLSLTVMRTDLSVDSAQKCSDCRAECCMKVVPL